MPMKTVIMVMVQNSGTKFTLCITKKSKAENIKQYVFSVRTS